MKEIKNLELDFKVTKLIQEGEIFVETEEKYKLNYAFLIKQLAKVEIPNQGVGDLEEQIVRMNIIEKTLKVDKSDIITFEDAEIKLLKSLLKYYKFRILHKDLIQFQKTISNI